MRILLDVIRGRMHGLLRLRPARPSMVLQCLGQECGKCCRALGRSVLVESGEILAVGSGSVVARGDTVYVRSDGTACCLLRNEVCGLYPKRPRGCREYPWYRIGASFFYDKGCPGIRFGMDSGPDGEDGRPDVDGLRDIHAYFEALPRPVTRGLIALLTRW